MDVSSVRLCGMSAIKQTKIIIIVINIIIIIIIIIKSFVSICQTLCKRRVCCCRDVSGGKRYVGEDRIPGRTVIITGASSGIGKETARELANRGQLAVVTVWLNGNGIVHINEVALRWARLVLGWVTILWFNSWSRKFFLV